MAQLYQHMRDSNKSICQCGNETTVEKVTKEKRRQQLQRDNGNKMANTRGKKEMTTLKKKQHRMRQYWREKDNTGKGDNVEKEMTFGKR